MKKNEFMAQLKHYFRNSEPADLQGIIEDCEEQFRLGTKKREPEEYVCYRLGHPHNIYRYYIGEPIVPEENEQLNPDRFAAYETDPHPPVRRPYDVEPASAPHRAVPEYSRTGSRAGRIFFGFLCRFFYSLMALTCLGGIFWMNLPPYCVSEWLPLPQLSLQTLIYTVLALFFAGLTCAFLKRRCRTRRTS